MIENYRKTMSVREIMQLLKNSRPEKSLIWQNQGDSRVVCAVESLVFNETLNTMQVSVLKYRTPLIKDETLYVKASYRDTVFKAKIISIIGNRISLYIPIEVRTLEERRHPRTSFKPKDEKTVIISLGDLLSEVSHVLRFSVIDISETGISILFSDKVKPIFENSQQYILTYLGEDLLDQPVVMDLKYAKTMKYRSRGKIIQANRAGFKFVDPIPKHEYNWFLGQFQN
jgi:c-di-GMP-binding flagellar brake protein YcgR